MDDGQIAELIDGRTDGRADGRTGGRTDGQTGHEVEAHLSGCAACRERVDEARQIAERARAILGAAVPATKAGAVVPPFEEILHRAGRAKRSRRRGGSLRWLAWAATVVFAGGLGWYARGELRGSFDGSPTVAHAPAAPADELRANSPAESGRVGFADTAPAQATQPARDAAGPPVQGQRQLAATPPATERVAEGALRAREEAPRQAREADALRDRAGGESKATGAPLPAAAPAPLPPARSDDLESRLRLRAAEPENERAANLTVEAVRRTTDVLDRRIVLTSKETAEQVVGGPVAAVEGVPIQEYYLLEGQQVVQTVQRLPDGGVLELDQWRVSQPRTVDDRMARAMAPTGRAAAQQAVAAETLVVGGLRIAARAPISADSLRALLQRLRR